METPFRYSDVPAFIESIDQALALDFDVFVAGHGQTGTKQDIFAYSIM